MENNYEYTVSSGINDFQYNIVNSITPCPNVKIRDMRHKLPGEFKYIFETKDLSGTASVFIKEVIYNDPATIVLWSDGTKTVSKCADGDEYNNETGLAICVLKKLVGGVKVHDLFEDWLPTSGNRVTLQHVRNKHRK